jgi:hypothetical protein
MKSMRGCSLIDKYRDKELGDAERSEFESHLAICGDCRTAMSLLNNVAYLAGGEEVRPRDLADRIAQRAFQKGRAWDSEIISWLRPGPALAALSLMLALFSFLLMTSGTLQVGTYSEYEKLMDEVAESSDLGVSSPQVRNNSELVFWLEQEGIPSD